MDSKICLIRHGITEGNKNRLYYGHADIPLADEGIRELKELAAEGIYPDGEGAFFYTTGLLRTEQTMKLIYGEREHEIIEGLREINFGDFEMKSHYELMDLEEYKTWMADEAGELAPPNGESPNAFFRRVKAGFEDLKSRHALNVISMRHKSREALSVVVCHGGSISAILESLYPGEKQNFYEWIPDPGHGYILLMKDGGVDGVEKF